MPHDAQKMTAQESEKLKLTLCVDITDSETFIALKCRAEFAVV
jgi:hypothetical protein